MRKYDVLVAKSVEPLSWIVCSANCAVSARTHVACADLVFVDMLQPVPSCVVNVRPRQVSALVGTSLEGMSWRCKGGGC